MKTQIFTNIKLIANIRESTEILRGRELSKMPCIENGYIVIEGDIIAEVGAMEDFRFAENKAVEVDEGTIVLPAWCDSHTHLVYASNRESEFVDKIRGLSYAEIAANG